MGKKLISFSNMKKKGNKTFFLGVQVESVCTPNPCQNEGYCFDTGEGSFFCYCRPAFTGPLCNQSMGECVSVLYNRQCMYPLLVDKKTCYYFLFKFVSTEISDPCSSRPCLNSGICSSVGTSQFKCFCSPGYTGTHCEHAQGPLSHITESFKH